MSWIDKLSNDLTIKTGDKLTYKPLWMRPSKTTEYNYAEFKFPNLSGSLVVRGMPIGRRFPLEIYFVGENHLDVASEFEISSSDKRAWEVEHPYYGLITVQPISISFDNTGDNVSKITIQVIETIVEGLPKVKEDPLQSILLQKIQLDELTERDIIAPIQADDINTLDDINTKSFNFTVPIIKLPEQLTKLVNAFNKAKSLIATATASAQLAMRAATSVLNYPAQLKAGITDRLASLQGTFDNLKNTAIGMTGVASKQIFQSQSISVLSSMCVVSVTPEDLDYTNSMRVMEISDSILNNYNEFMRTLDTLQSENGGNPNSYIPSVDTVIAFSNMVNFTLANLQTIALNSRTERTIITEKDTNIILLAHRFYGLDPSDKNINELFANNNWGLNQILEIPKNTKVTYYI